MVLDGQQLVRNLLSNKYLLFSSKNPGFSLRAFSKKLDVSSAALSEILRGKRKVSREKALHFCKVLRTDKRTTETIDRAFSEHSLKTLGGLANPYKEIVVGPEMYDLFSDWIYFGIVSLLRTVDVKSDRTWIACRLGATEERVNRAISRLLEWKILSEDSNGNLIDQQMSFRTADEMPKEIVTVRELEILDAARTEIQKEVRKDANYFFMATTDPTRLKVAATMIEEFGKQLCFFLNSGEKREVYELNINLFPRSTRDGMISVAKK